jgi:predicted nucleic acid-binding protein
LNGRLGAGIPDAALDEFVTCGPVVQEVLQGLRALERRAFGQWFDAIPRVCDPVPEKLFVAAAEIYRLGRQSGYTVRSPVDCLIAAIAIEAGVPLWHRDSDFDHISRFTELSLLRPPEQSAATS